MMLEYLLIGLLVVLSAITILMVVVAVLLVSWRPRCRECPHTDGGYTSEFTFPRRTMP